ncbi:hypothetical protein KFL_002600050 [Klebsormidium nitens]|uniref:Uncharacterized protein n=1 Tax=Klebsormidium nitens TaxID=105231 RepID=A0A1Y1IB03_KLENI|nr:hypothetical protein KFL_002600050 [Klebsormidium nitens]|eukprot:GAQ85897.1 hypothetical protein KFL_002600050 [Klebsormidium nitens]
MADKGAVRHVGSLPRALLFNIASLLESPDIQGHSDLKSFMQVCKEWCLIGREAAKHLVLRCQHRGNNIEGLSTALHIFRNPDRKLNVVFCRRVSMDEVARVVASSGLKHLELRFPPMYSRTALPLPAAFAQMNELESFVLHPSQGIRFLPFEVKSLPPEVVRSWVNIRTVSINGLGSVDLSGIGRWELLEELTLRDAKIEALPEEVGAWRKLRKLCLAGCSNLTALPGAVQSWAMLTEVDFQDCTALADLPAGVAAWLNLCKVSFENCYRLAALPEATSAWRSVEVASFKGCYHLVSLSALGGWCDLTSLDLEGVPCGDLPNGAQTWRRLADLRVDNVQETLPEFVGNWGCLRRIKLALYGAAATLPEAIGGWENLTTLTLSGELETLPDRVAGWTRLQMVDLSGCNTLRYLPEEVENWTSLERITLHGSDNPRLLNSGVRGWTSLKALSFGENSLTWHDCNPIPIHLFDGKSPDLLPRIELPFEVGAWARLETLVLGRVMSLPEAVEEWRALRTLYIHEYESEQLPEGIGSWSKLTSLQMASSHLQRFPSSVGAWEALKTLDLRGCAQLTGFPVEAKGWRSLRVLKLAGCIEFLALPEGVGSWENLEELDLGECMESITSHHVFELSLEACAMVASLPHAQRCGQIS